MKMPVCTRWFLFVSIFLLMTNYVWASEKNNFQEKSFELTVDITSIQKIIESSFQGSRYQFKKSSARSAGVYFDTPELSLLRQSGYLRIDAVEYQSKKGKTKFHETIQYSRLGKTEYNLEVKHYNRVKSFEGKHPLLGLVKRKERSGFLEVLNTDGFIHPLRFKQIAKLTRISYIYKISLNGIHVVNISVHEIKTAALNQESTFNIISLRSNGSQKGNESFKKLSAVLLKALKIQKDDIFDNEYSVLHHQLKIKTPYFDWLLCYPFLINLLYSLFIGLFGLIFICLVLQRKK